MKYQRKRTISHLNTFNDNHDLRLDKKVEKEYYFHPAVFIINEILLWKIQSPLRQVQSRACQEIILDQKFSSYILSTTYLDFSKRKMGSIFKP